MTRVHPLAGAAAVLLTLTGVIAQNGNVLSVLDVETPTAQGKPGTGSFGNLGVASFVNAAGKVVFHVSSAGQVHPVTGNWTGTNNPPHSMFVFTHRGAYVRSYLQPVPAWPRGVNASGAWQWGFRDGANDQKFTGAGDPAATTFFWGNEDGLWLQDQNGSPKLAYRAAAGLVAAPAMPIQGPGLAVLGSYRAVAYNPAGTGSWFTANFGSALIEIDNRGNILRNHPNSSGWSIYGLAWDPTTQMLWANASSNSDHVVEIDPVAGIETGRRIWVGPGQSGNPGNVGGLDIVLDDRTICQTILGNGRRNGGTTLVALQQNAPADALFTYLLDYDTDTTPSSPVTLTRTEHGRLEVGVNGTLTGDAATVTAGVLTADFGLTDPSGNDVAAAMHLTLNNGASGAAVLPPLIPGLDHVVCGWSLRASSLLTSPGALDLSLPLVPGATVRLPVALITPSFTKISAQALVVNRRLGANPNVLPIYASNRVKFDVPCASTPGLPATIGVSVAANGSNSYNQNTATGFWSITNNSAFPILSAELAFPPRFTNGWFDTDQPNMGWPGPGGLSAPTYSNHFTAGNAPYPQRAPRCAGTYRNNSHVTTGLIFGRAGARPVEPCATGLATGVGFTPGTSAGWAVGDSMTATHFAFAGGMFAGGATLEWDCDTDGRGVSGAAHAGVQATITFAGIMPNGTNGIWCGVLAPSPFSPQQAIASR